MTSLRAQSLVQVILALLHEQQKVLQPVWQVQWATFWKALGM